MKKKTTLIQGAETEREIVLDSESGWAIIRRDYMDDGEWVVIGYCVKFFGAPMEIVLDDEFVSALWSMSSPDTCLHCGGEFDEDNPPAGVMCRRCDNDFKAYCSACDCEITPVGEAVPTNGNHMWHKECLEKLTCAHCGKVIHPGRICSSGPSFVCERCRDKAMATGCHTSHGGGAPDEKS
ncbi:MAG: hypothetical protein AMS21_01205 [Gemmatimonas sp. SG8_38_2]|nr:MAG: hypothetical protein AMS21_01205 [Gemmatimonas sp. SG8_38_2]